MEKWSREASSLAIKEYSNIRKVSEIICRPLETEDFVIQGMEDVSPPKWHLAHTTWFFENFILIPFFKNYRTYNPHFLYLFNSYYQKLGQPYARKNRGLLSRPTVKEVFSYRKYVDLALIKFLNKSSSKQLNQIKDLLLLGLNHEQQHQELLLMDIKYNFSLDPKFPVYTIKKNKLKTTKIPCLKFIEKETTFSNIGSEQKTFFFDNEAPVHSRFINTYSIANRLICNAEYLEFIEDKGYENAGLWLADGWEWVCKNNIQAPLYWLKQDKEWFIFTLNGLQPLNLNEPVVHVSFFEADAFARWRGKRLPSEFEWENFVTKHIKIKPSDNFLERSILHPIAVHENRDFNQFYGDVWEWTSSPYTPYPNYKSYQGYLEEYNGKFMCNQWVLRGGSCITPISHIRPTYRNFFKAENRWQFSGIRLAQDEN